MKQITLTTAFLALFALASGGEPSPEIKIIPGGLSGKGISGTGGTTCYWDCCKPSCAWQGNIHTPNMVPVTSCAIDGNTVIDANEQSGCGDGNSYMCNNQQPFVINSTLAYGFSAISFAGGTDYDYCCACFMLTFIGQLPGKKMVVQYTNTGGDLLVNQFDLAVPGGGVGYNTQGCVKQWNAPPDGWGQRYGGVATRAECDQLPSVLQDGCRWRFDWWEGAQIPQVDFVQVQCPAEIVARSGCSL